MGKQANCEYPATCLIMLALVMIQIATISSSLFRGDVSYVASTEVPDIAIIEFASTYIMGH
ncbi:hypothetical protein BDR04DRAFT_1095229 [Suillus decipiens]|nr:hypothetical protein BDR04DRAFT_1095229 [Suillus decipiens]